MSRIIRLTENDLNKIIKNVINESLNIIQLQFINGYFYPVDSVSSKILEKEFELGRIPENRLDVLSPKLVNMGYKLAISNYDYPQMDNDMNRPRGVKIGGIPKPQKNPCTKCGFNGLCDSECGKKGFRLY